MNNDDDMALHVRWTDTLLSLSLFPSHSPFHSIGIFLLSLHDFYRSSYLPMLTVLALYFISAEQLTHLIQNWRRTSSHNIMEDLQPFNKVFCLYFSIIFFFLTKCRYYCETATSRRLFYSFAIGNIYKRVLLLLMMLFFIFLFSKNDYFLSCFRT